MKTTIILLFICFSLGSTSNKLKGNEIECRNKKITVVTNGISALEYTLSKEPGLIGRGRINVYINNNIDLYITGVKKELDNIYQYLHSTGNSLKMDTSSCNIGKIKRHSK
ncbi:MAG: hypothetical protein OCD01_05625 [Fibrobacterales bacterium]